MVKAAMIRLILSLAVPRAGIEDN
jgi:hypothetical protein